MDCSLLYLSIAPLIGQSLMTVCRKWNWWVQEGHTECCVGSPQPAVSNCREDRHLTHMSLKDHTATSRSQNQEMGSSARQQVSAQTVYWHHIMDRSFSGAFNHKSWCKNGMMSCFQTNLILFSIRMATSIFGASLHSTSSDCPIT